MTERQIALIGCLPATAYEAARACRIHRRSAQGELSRLEKLCAVSSQRSGKYRVFSATTVGKWAVDGWCITYYRREAGARPRLKGKNVTTWLPFELISKLRARGGRVSARMREILEAAV